MISAGRTARITGTYGSSEEVPVGGVSEKGSGGNPILLGLLTTSLAYLGRRRRGIVDLTGTVCPSPRK
jgi:uncharacterized protein (TIGR03382 family)